MRGEATITQSFSWTEPALCSSPSHTCAGRWIGCILMDVDQLAATSASSTSQAESSPHPVGHRRRVCCSQKGEAGGHDGRTAADALAAARVSGGGSPRRFGVAWRSKGVARRRRRAAPISEHALNMEHCLPGGAVSVWIRSQRKCDTNVG